MRLNNTKTFLVILLMFWGFISYHPAAAQTAPAAADTDATRIELMVQVVTSASTPEALRIGTARNLLNDPDAHPALIQMLCHENNLEAKIIVCRAIAEVRNNSHSLWSSQNVLEPFIDPLFALLKSDNPDLATASARALARCRDGVPGRLADIAASQECNLTSRMAAIEALQLIPGKQSVLALAQLLEDDEPRIVDKAEQVLAETLYMTNPIDIEHFRAELLPRLKKMNENHFLLWQSEQRLKRIQILQQELTRSRLDTQQWQSRYFRSEKDKFDQIKELEKKLDYLKPFLQNTQDDMLRVWALERANEWSKTATVRTGPITQALVDVLIGLIADSHPEVRRLTALTLAELDFQTARTTASLLLEQLAREQNTRTQAALLSALGTFEYVPALEQAQDKLARADDPAVVSQAVRAVGRIAATQAKEINGDQMAAIIPQLGRSYERWSENVGLKSRFIETMQKIAAQERFHNGAVKHFQAIVEEALRHPAAEVRTQAIYALPEVVKTAQVMPILLGEANDLLNDPDNTVRFAVLVSIEQYGGQEHLELLNRRLTQESDPDIIKRIETTFIRLLTKVPVAGIVEWAAQLENADAEEQQLLRQMILRHLLERMAAAKNSGQTIEPEYEAYTYRELAETAITKQQPEQAIRYYHKILGLPIAEPDKQKIAERILNLALTIDDENNLAGLKTIIQPLLHARTGLYEIIARACGVHHNNEQQLLRQIVLIEKLVLPVNKLPTAELQQQWQKHVGQKAAAVITLLENKLNSSQTIPESDPLLIYLARLDTRLNGFPVEADLEEQKKTLQDYRRLLQSAPVGTAVNGVEQSAEKTTAVNNGG